MHRCCVAAGQRACRQRLTTRLGWVTAMRPSLAYPASSSICIHKEGWA